MARWIVLIGFSLICLTAAQSEVGAAEDPQRIALIIANSDYDPRGVPPLKGPERDAELMDIALSNIGFETLVVRDAKRSQMARSFLEFSDRLQQAPPGSSGFVYYSGHGTSFGTGKDYLIGVDLKGHSDRDIEAASFHYQTLVSALEAAGEGRNIVLAMDTNRVVQASSSRGFAELVDVTPPNVFEIWASRYGDYAVDTAEGTGGASPFSYALAQALETPGLDVRAVFAEVQSRVLELTHGDQYPEVFIPHLEPLVLNVSSERAAALDLSAISKTTAGTAPLVQSSTSAGNVGAALELALWQSAVELNTADAIDDFLEKFPESLLADQALLRREALRKRVVSTLPPVTAFETLAPINTVPGPPRIALLIGNKAYAPHLSELTNPHNDIDLVGQRLREVGFEVMLARDADPDEMVKALAAFTQRLSDATSKTTRPAAFFYYSGHGFAPQEQGRNYLVPVGMKVTTITELLRAMSIESVVERVEAMKPHVAFFVFDACRNDPGLPGAQEGTKSAAGAKGFTLVNVSGGSLISYATAEGKVAFDTPEEEVGPYARALAEGLQLEGADAYGVFKHAQRTVYRTSGETQLPWISDRLIEDFTFRE